MVEVKLVDILELHVLKFRQVLVRHAEILNSKVGLNRFGSGFGRHLCGGSFHNFDDGKYSWKSANIDIITHAIPHFHSRDTFAYLIISIVLKLLFVLLCSYSPIGSSLLF